MECIVSYGMNPHLLPMAYHYDDSRYVVKGNDRHSWMSARGKLI